MPMEVKDIFEANSKNVREMLSETGMGLYVPPYQRPYGWDKDKVAKLVEDILHGYASLLVDEESFTFLGTVITIHDINFITVQPIVRQDVPAKVLTVIDGQQRLTSLIMLCLALHNQIRIIQRKLTKGRKENELTEEEKWLNGQALRIVQELSSTFHERQAYGNAPPYPRMIRSFDDQWARNSDHAIYNSPISHLISTYVASLPAAGAEEPAKVSEFKPVERGGNIEGEEAVIERYTQLLKLIKGIAADKFSDEMEELPSLSDIAKNAGFQRSLLNHEFPQAVSACLSNEPPEQFGALLRLVLITSYILNRVALTVVRGKNEHYAFSVFESLNTTGEPLTAFETFKPRVVAAETLARYEASKSRTSMEDISGYLSTFKVGDRLQVATRDLLITFAAAETGFKLSKRLADQRRYLKDEFERHESNQQAREGFVRNLRDVAMFIDSAWKYKPELSGLPVEAASDSVKLCMSFLYSLNHSITVAPIARFYAEALSKDDSGRPQAIKNLEDAVKAITAFSALWRASRRGTDNIDAEYRELLLGTAPWNAAGARGAAEAPLARVGRPGSQGPAPKVDVVELKDRLRARLANPEHGAIPDRQTFIDEAGKLPIYSISKVVARFMLLAAYHDAVEDPQAPGLIIPGKTAVSPCLTFNGLVDERHLTLEHIAPQQRSEGWDANIWSEKERINTIGNLVLAPHVENASLSNRPWAEKKVLYSALSAQSQTDAESILHQSGINFGVSTQQIASESHHLHHLAAVAQYPNEWSVEFIQARSERLLGIAYDRLIKWLQ
jgi:hypothetical protein